MSSTLQQVADFCSAKFGATDAATVVLAKDFAKARHRVIWDGYFWKETKVSESQALAADIQDVTFSTNIDKVVRIRWDNRQLLPVNQEQVFQIDPEAFDTAGEVVAFSELPKSAGGAPKIRLYSIPQDARTITVLGKAPTPTLTDASTSPLSGVDQCWIAYVNGDLQQWARQFGKANVYFEEARFFYEKMIEIEQEQSAYQAQIIPYDDEQYDRDDLYYE